MHKTTGAFLSLAAACLLASCVSSGRHNGLAPSVPNRAGEYRLPPAGTYRIDPDRSELRFLVYRAGALGGGALQVEDTLRVKFKIPAAQ